jgi:hypothetical protein
MLRTETESRVPIYTVGSVDLSDQPVPYITSFVLFPQAPLRQNLPWSSTVMGRWNDYFL